MVNRIEVSIGRQNYYIERVFEQILCVCLVFPFCEPSGLTQYLDFEWNYFLLAEGIILLIANLQLKKIRKIELLIGLYYTVTIFSTLINEGELFIAIYYAARMICFVVLIRMYANQKRLEMLLSTFKIILGSFILITLFIQIVNHDMFGFTISHNHINFLTADNELGYWYVPFTLIVYLSNVRKSKRYQIVDLIFWTGTCIYSLVISWAATCMTVYILFAILLIFHKMKIFRVLTPLKALIINIGISIAIIFFQCQKYFEWLIIDILHKDLTLSMRTYIWAGTLQNILRSPLIGYGTAKGGKMHINTIIGGRMSGALAFSHNIFLEIVIQAGIVGLLIYVIMHYCASKEINKYSGDASVIINLALFALLLMQFSEFAMYIPIANLPLILCFFYKDLIKEGMGEV